MGLFAKYILIAFRSSMRLLANHCIIPNLRVVLFKLSGIQIGKRVTINMDTKFIDNWIDKQIFLEDEVSLASFVSLVASSNPNDSFINKLYEVSREDKVIVKNGAWLGIGVVALPGVTIGKGAIIGANSVVTHDVDDYAIMAGVPARKIGDVRDKKRRLLQKSDKDT